MVLSLGRVQLCLIVSKAMVLPVRNRMVGQMQLPHQQQKSRQAGGEGAPLRRGHSLSERQLRQLHAEETPHCHPASLQSHQTCLQTCLLGDCFLWQQSDQPMTGGLAIVCAALVSVQAPPYPGCLHCCGGPHFCRLLSVEKLWSFL